MYFIIDWGMAVSTPEIAFAAMTVVATFLYLAIPNRITFVISIAGAVVWACSGLFWIAMLS